MLLKLEKGDYMKLYKESKYNLIIKSDINNVLLYNTVSGAVCNFTMSVYNSFSGKNCIHEDDLLDGIIRLGFVVPCDMDETAELEKCKCNYIFNDDPDELSYVIAPTLSCNYRCEYCFEADYHSNTTMDDCVIGRTIDFIKNQCKIYRNVKRIYILWFGGEPCLGIDAITKISMPLIEFCTENQIKYDSFMVTNGSLLTEKISIFLRDTCSIQGVQISLDGLKDRYSNYRNCSNACFDKVLSNVISLSKIWYIHLRFNVDIYNSSEIEHLVRYILSSDINRDNLHIYFAPVKDYSNNSNHALSGSEFESIRGTLIDIVDSYGASGILRQSLPAKVACGCGAMRHYTCVIGPNGELYRCEHCLGNPDLVIGSLTDGFFHNEVDQMFLDYPTPQKCLECNILPVCAQGCRADILIHNLSFDCDSFRKRIVNNVLRCVKLKKTSIGIQSDNAQNTC